MQKLARDRVSAFAASLKAGGAGGGGGGEELGLCRALALALKVCER